MRSAAENSVSAITEVGNAYIDIAVDEPNLFKYLFLNGGGNGGTGTFDAMLSAVNIPDIVRRAAKYFGISEDKAREYIINSVVYTHGLLALVVTGVFAADRNEVKRRTDSAGYAFLQQVGGNAERARCLRGLSRSAPTTIPRQCSGATAARYTTPRALTTRTTAYTNSPPKR